MDNTQEALYLNREKFLECNWELDIPEGDHHGYSTIRMSLQALASKMLDAEKHDSQKILELLFRASSMMLVPDSLNEPFKPIFEDFQMGRRSATPEDFTEYELSFFEQILDDINEPYLKARIADLLWLLLKPKKIHHVKIAIDTYLMHDIDDKSWHRDIGQCFERAARLAIQSNDWERLDKIKSLLFAAFLKEYPNSKYMQLWLADLLDKLRIDKDLRSQIGQNIYKKAQELKNTGDFHSAISYFELSAKKNKQCNEQEKYLESLIGIAECYESEADIRSAHSNLAANGFYENAIQAYRRIPAKERNRYSIENKIRVVRTKIISSGQASLDEMVSLESPPVDISELVEVSIEHVKGKPTPQDALLYFTGITHPTNYEQLLKNSQETLQNSIFGSLFGGRHLSRDGRVIAKTPSMNLNASTDDLDNQAVLYQQMQSQFAIHIDLAIQSQILPALRQLLTEHRVTKELIIALCNQSPIVPKDRAFLLGNALWLGFEEEFGLAIHLLCPQVEHIVRSKLKEAGCITTNLDKNGIENENGLSTLMELPETEQIFGKSLVFELKSIFTEAIGFNLRNNVAHGLLDDNDSISLASIYAWWMILRLVIRSIVSGQIKRD